MSVPDAPTPREVEELAALLDLATTIGGGPAAGASPLARTAAAVHRGDLPAMPSPAFRATLKEHVMRSADPFAVAFAPTPSPNGHRPHAVPATAPAVARPRAVWGPLPSSGRRRGLIEFLSLAALIPVVFAQAMGSGGNLAFWRQGAAPSPTSGPVLAAPGGDATPGTSPVADGAGAVAMERGNPGRTGVYDTTGPEELPALLWRHADPSGEPHDALEPIVAGDTVHVSTYRGGGYFVTPTTLPSGEGGYGSWLQTSPTRNNVVFGEGLTFAQILGVGNGESGPEARAGTLVAYDQASAEERWRVAIQIAGRSSPVVVDGTLVVVTDDDLIALDAATGAERWRTPVAPYSAGDVPVARNPAVEGDTVVVNELSAGDGSGPTGSLRAFDLATGKEHWTVGGEGGYFGPPSVSDGIAYASYIRVEGCCAVSRLLAIDVASGDEVWETPGKEVGAVGFGGSWGSPAVDGTSVYTFARLGDELVTTLSAQDKTTGEVRWQRDVSDSYGSQITIVGGTLYYTLDDGVVYGASAADGSELWRIDTGDAFLGTPVPADGYLVIASRTAVYAFGSAAVGADVPVDVSGLPPCDPPRPLLPTPPSGDTAHGLVPIEDNPLGYGVPTGGRMLLADVPTGEPADAATVAGIYATLRGLAACDRPGAELERAAFYSDDYFRRFAVVERRPGDTHSVYADLFPVGDLTVADLGAPYLLDDTRVAVLAFDPLGDRGTLLVFDEQDGAWLIDEVIDVGVSAEVWRQG